MRRRASLFLVIALVVGLAACILVFLFGLKATAPQPAEPEEVLQPEPEELPVSEPEEPAPEPVVETPVDKLQLQLDDMTLEEKLCQLLIVRPELLTGADSVTAADDAMAQALAQWPVGGIIYFANNLVNREQTRQMVAQTQAYSAIPLFIGVDEEGGSVARLASQLGTATFDDMAVYGAQGDPQVAYEIGSTLAAELKQFGFNLDFAPVADVWTSEENTVVRDRSFGSDPQLVAQMVAAEVQGFVEGDVVCSPKHFPGHGSTGGDTHLGFASTDRSREELEACDLLPFRACIDAGAPMIMAGHMTLSALDPDAPACLSPTIISGLLRQELGYDGLIITDSLIMQAITDNYSTGEAAVLAILAGCDILLDVASIPDTVQALKEAVENGTIPEARIDESVLRVLRCKQAYGILPDGIQ